MCFSRSVIHTGTFVCLLCQVAVRLKLQTCSTEGKLDKELLEDIG